MWEAMSAAEPVDRPQCESPVWRVAGISVFTVDACGVCPTCGLVNHGRKEAR